MRVNLFNQLEPGLWVHNAWKAAYLGPGLYRWFLQHHTKIEVPGGRS